MNLSMKQKHTYRHREQGEEAWGMRALKSEIANCDIGMDKLQGPTV